jgi:predicted 3-demethylubiquinone-9 3-methyltransferase (glyoxalase superfamily)
MNTFLLAAVLALPAAGQGERPDWMSGRSAAYPRSAYLTGLGQGPTQADAADRARAELAKRFGVSLSAVSRTAAVEAGSGDSSSSWQEVSDEVKTSVRKVLDGVEVAAYWQGPESWHAFAVLDRAHSLQVFADRLAEIDRSWEELCAELSRAEGKFARLRPALRLRRLAQDRRRLNADYRILKPDGKGVPAPASYQDALSRARKAVSAVTVAVEVTGRDGRRLTSRLMDALSATGLKVVEKAGAARPDIVVESEAEGTPLPPENLTWYWARGSIMTRLSYGSTGEVFSRFEEAGQDAAGDPGTAVDLTLRALAERTAAHVFSAATSAELADD